MRYRHAVAPVWYTAALVAAVIAAGGCADPAAEPAPPEIPLRGGMPAGLVSIPLDTLFQLGAASGEAWETFEGIWDIEVDAEGRLAILDVGRPAVHVYDSAGAHLATIDEAGSDAGQLEGPSGIAWNSPVELFVWDPGSSWISRFRVAAVGAEFVDRTPAVAFGETGFCAGGGRTYLSYLEDGSVIHEVGAEGPVRSFGPAPAVAGAETLGPELQGIALEEMTPSALLCTSAGVVDVGFVEGGARLHGWDGAEVWSRELGDFRPVVVYSDDGIGLGRRFDPGEGSHLLRSLVAWGDSLVLVQHELRVREIPEAGEPEVFESRLLDLVNGMEVARSRGLPLVLAVGGKRLYLVRQSPFPAVTVVAVGG